MGTRKPSRRKTPAQPSAASVSGSSEEEAAFFAAIAESSHVEDFRDYLSRYGEQGKFADAARRRIAALERDATLKKSPARRGWAIAAAAVFFVSAMVGVLQYLKIDVVALIQAATTGPVVLQPGQARIEIAGKAPATGTVTWSRNGMLDPVYTATVRIPDLPIAATIRFEAPRSELGEVRMEVVVDGVPALPALATVSEVAADGQPLAATLALLSASTGHATYGLAGGATNLTPLATAGTMALRLTFADGATGVLRLTGPEDTEAFTTFLLHPQAVLVWNDDGSMDNRG